MTAAKNFAIAWGMVIDVDKCTGCGACMVACQAENNIAPATDASDKLKALNWLVVYELTNKKPFPDHDVAYLPRPCQQCGNPPCVSVCPVTATDKNEEGGIVSQVTPRCIGCRYCMAACPFHARYFNWFDPVWPKGMEKTLTPDVSVRPRGVVEKCTFCHHRWMAAKDKAIVEGRNPNELADGEYVPACAQMCPNGAIVFGDLKNSDHAIYQILRAASAKGIAFQLLSRTHKKDRRPNPEPQVYYLSRRKWVRDLASFRLPKTRDKE